MPQKLAIFTEKEADQRFCPITLGRGGGRCLGSPCMAWRWWPTHVHDPEGGPDLVPSSDTYGYCGMAGPPAPERRDG